MSQEPIFTYLTECDRHHSVNFGCTDGFEQMIYVSNASNSSRKLAKIAVKRYIHSEGFATFTLYIDDEPVIRGTWKGTLLEKENRYVLL